MNEAFTFYASFYESIKNLKKSADRLKVYDAICEYGITGEAPDCDGVAKSIFMLIKPVIDANLAKREAGAKGGKAESKAEAKRKQNESKVEAKEKEPSTDIELDIDIDKDKDIDIDKEHECVVTARARAREDIHDTTSKNDVIRIPTIDAVSDENSDQGYGLTYESLQGFMEYNKSRGWKLNWKNALKKWAEQEKKRSRPSEKKNTFTGFEDQHKYDFEALERDVLSKPPIGGFYAANDTG